MRNPLKKIMAQLKSHFGNSDAPALVKRRQLMLVSTVFIIVVFILWLMVRSSGGERAQQAAPSVTQSNFSSPLEGMNAMTLYLTEIQEKLATSIESNERLSKQIETIFNDQQQVSGQISTYETTLGTMQTQLNQYNEAATKRTQEARLPAVNEAANAPNPLRQNPSLTQADLNDPVLNNLSPAPQIKIINIDLTQETEITQAPKTSQHYIPPGTFVRAVMLNGLDADTSVSGQGAPKPVVMRVTGWGNLPNHYKSRLKDCVVVGAGVGDISSERAYIRLDTLSCVLNDGNIIDVNAFGHVVDSSDGKVGVKGTLRMNAGKLVSSAFFSGVVSGLGNGVSQQYMTSYSSPLGQTTALDPSRSLQYGLASGVGETGNRMSDYFIRRADQYNPVIQVPPQAVDIIFIKEGVWFDNNPSPGNTVNHNTIDQNTRLTTEIQRAANLFNQNQFDQNQ